MVIILVVVVVVWWGALRVDLRWTLVVSRWLLSGGIDVSVIWLLCLWSCCLVWLIVLCTSL